MILYKYFNNSVQQEWVREMARIREEKEGEKLERVEVIRIKNQN